VRFVAVTVVPWIDSKTTAPELPTAKHVVLVGQVMALRIKPVMPVLTAVLDQLPAELVVN
jgi:hypothetical protein